MNSERLKIFISAYACEPGKGSEPGIGWNVVNEMAKYNEVHVLTRSNNREAIENALKDCPGEHPVFHYCDLPRALSFWKRKRRGYRLYYYLWQYGAFFRYRKFVDSGGFDTVHHLTFASFSMPSLFMLCRPLTVWGPVGILPVPENIRRALPLKVRVREGLRRLVMTLLCHCEPMRILTPRMADCLLEYREIPRSGFPEKWQNRVIRHSQTGIDPGEPEYQLEPHRGKDGRIHLLICSEFVHWKGCTFAAEAAAVLLRRIPQTVLDIVGSGPEQNAMEKYLNGPDIWDRVFRHGFLSRKEMLQALADSDILLYPSYHHGLATVILQAMYFRLPVVALEGDSVAETIRLGCGLTASGSGKKEIIASLVRETEKLIRDPELRRTLGNRGRQLIETRYDWKILCGRLNGIYHELLEKDGKKCR